MCNYYHCSFHNQLKNNPTFMNGKVNKRVDGLLHLLLKYEINSFFNRQTKELMWKHNRKEAREKERHQLGSRIADKDFKASKFILAHTAHWLLTLLHMNGLGLNIKNNIVQSAYLPITTILNAWGSFYLNQFYRR